jgi:prepilin-type N-terminal cleavage/methylation domain-containing protein
MRITDYRIKKRGVMQDAAYESQTPNAERRTLNSKGFTLIEIVITIVLISILSGVAALIILQGVRSYSAEGSRSNMHYQARLAVERMAREIRLVRSQTAADITTMNPTLIRYTDISGKQMGFRLNAGNIERTQDNAATWETLATGVTALAFTYLRQDGVTGAAATNLWFVVIDVTDQQGTETLQMRTRVHPMNF